MNISPHHQRPTNYPWPGIASRAFLVLAVIVILLVALILVADPFRSEGTGPDQAAESATNQTFS